jgi:hypothetical protein
VAFVLQDTGRKLITAIVVIETKRECMQRPQVNGCREAVPRDFPLLHSLSLLFIGGSQRGSVRLVTAATRYETVRRV